MALVDRWRRRRRKCPPWIAIALLAENSWPKCCSVIERQHQVAWSLPGRLAPCFEPKPLSFSSEFLAVASASSPFSQRGSSHRLSFCTLSDSDVLVMPFSSPESSPECRSPQTSDRLRGSEAGVKVPHNLSGYMKIMYARIAVYRIR